MNQQIISSICSQVYRRFPDLNGSQPKVHSRPGEQFLLVFSGSSRTADGRSIAQTVRVVASASGKVLKMTSSR